MRSRSLFLLLPAGALAGFAGCRLDVGGLAGDTATFAGSTAGAAGAGGLGHLGAGGRDAGRGGGTVTTLIASSSSSGASVCTPEMTEPCYGGVPGTRGKGICLAGVATCNAKGSAFGACEGEVLPVPGPENCALGVDTDCDGDVLHCTGELGFVTSAGDTNADAALAVAVGPAGEVAITGDFSDGTFKAFGFGGTPAQCAGGVDLFVAELDATGAFLWGRGFGGLYDDAGLATAVDADGKVYVAGYTKSGLTFPDCAPMPNVAPATADGFVVKLDPTSTPPGKCLWSVSLGGSGDQNARGLALDAKGNAWVVGDFWDELVIGGTTLHSMGLSVDVFLARFDPMGNLTYLGQYGDDADQEGRAVAVDSLGGPVVAGRFQGSIDFVSGQPMVSAGGWDAYVARLAPTGDGLWSRRYGDGYDQVISTVAVDPSVKQRDQVLVGGQFAGALAFGALAPLPGNNGNGVGFAGRLDRHGVETWVNGYGDHLGDQEVNGVAVDAFGNTTLVGAFNGSIVTPPRTTAGYHDVFVVKLDLAGTVLWGQSYGDGAEQLGAAVAIDPATTSSWIAGTYQGTLNGATVKPPTSLGSYDAFVAHLHP